MCRSVFSRVKCQRFLEDNYLSGVIFHRGMCGGNFCRNCPQLVPCPVDSQGACWPWTVVRHEPGFNTWSGCVMLDRHY